MKKITIADSLFMQYARTSKLGVGNKDVTPADFEWELAEVEKARFVTDAHLKYAEGPGQVAFLLETFFLHPEDYLTALQKPFDHVLTHNSYFAKHKGWLWYPHGGSFVPFDQWKIYEKTEDVSILLSPKQQLWGHKKFHEVVKEFGDRVDVYGLDGYVDKLNAIAPYRYTIVVEAEQTHDFFSEKLIDCLAVGTIPIYWGCPNSYQYFNTRGIIRFENLLELDFELGRVLTMPFMEYTSKVEAIEDNLHRAKKFRVPEDWIYDHYPFLFEEK